MQPLEIKTTAENPTIIRCNLENVAQASEAFRQRGIGVQMITFNWGTVGTFADPDGNIVESQNDFDPISVETVSPNVPGGSLQT